MKVNDQWVVRKLAVRKCRMCGSGNVRLYQSQERARPDKPGLEWTDMAICDDCLCRAPLKVWGYALDHTANAGLEARDARAGDHA